MQIFRRCGATRFLLALCLFLLLIWLFLVAPTWAADDSWRTWPPATTTAAVTKIRVQAPAGPVQLTVTGPQTSPVGQPATLTVSGLPAVDLGKSIGEQTAWVQSLRFDVSAPQGAVVPVDKELSMTVSPWAWRLKLTFTPGRAGTHVVVCDWNESPYGLCLHRIEVGGSIPPDPPPQPPGPPLPNELTGPVWVIVLQDPETPTAAQAANLLDLRVWSDQHPQVQLVIETPDDPGEAAYRALVPADKAFPYFFLVRALRSSGKGHVCFAGELVDVDQIKRKAEEALK